MRIDLLLKAVCYLKNKRSDCGVEPLCLQCLDVADKSISFSFPAQLPACSIAFFLVCPCKQADEHMLALALKKKQTLFMTSWVCVSSLKERFGMLGSKDFHLLACSGFARDQSMLTSVVHCSEFNWKMMFKLFNHFNSSPTIKVPVWHNVFPYVMRTDYKQNFNLIMRFNHFIYSFIRYNIIQYIIYTNI